MKKAIETDNAPKAVGPYSQAVVVGNFVFCSGQIGLNPDTQALVEGGVETEAIQVLENLKAVLTAAGLTLKHVVKSEIFIKNISDFAKANDIYARYFTTDPKPARATIEVSNLPKGALIEISCIAYKQVCKLR